MNMLTIEECVRRLLSSQYDILTISETYVEDDHYCSTLMCRPSHNAKGTYVRTAVMIYVYETTPDVVRSACEGMARYDVSEYRVPNVGLGSWYITYIGLENYISVGLHFDYVKTVN